MMNYKIDPSTPPSTRSARRGSAQDDTEGGPNKKTTKKGFTLIEILVGLAVLTLAILSIFGAFRTGLVIVGQSRARTIASSLANQRLEMIRNLSYKDVGTIGGIPSGTISQSETINRNRINYTLETSITYIDDSFDGLAPDDTLNTDYKRVRVSASWSGPFFREPVVLITDVAPQGIETTAGGGTLLIKVFNANAKPVNEANVHIENNEVAPAISINTKTNTQGQVILPGAPKANENYTIIVTKDGYSTDRTYWVDPINNPSPSKPPLSVFESRITEASFFIDRISNLTIYSLDDSATPYWWNDEWTFRQQLIITNNEKDVVLPTGYPVSYSLDHYSLVEAGKSLASGNDIRIVWWNDGEWKELIRTPENDWNQKNKKTIIWFALLADIEKNGTDSNYYIYYGNPSAGPPPQDVENVYLPENQTPDLRELNKIGGYTIAFWDAEDGTGSTKLTDRADDNHGFLINMDPANDWVAGKFDTALDFDGNGYVEIPVSDGLKNFGNDGQIFTIEAWIYPTDTSGSKGIAGIGGNGRCYSGGYMLNTYWNNIVFGIVPPRNLGCTRFAISSPIKPNQWQHVAGTYDGQTMKLYLNGVLTAQKDIATRINPSAVSTFTIGHAFSAQGSATRPFMGKIDEVRVSSKVRVTDFLIPSVNGNINIVQGKIKGGSNLDIHVTDADLDRATGPSNDTTSVTVTTDNGDQENITLYETTLEGTFAGVIGTTNNAPNKNSGTLEIGDEVITATYLDVEAFDGATNQRRIDVALANDGPLHNLPIDSSTIAYWPLNRENDFVVDYSSKENLTTTNVERGLVGRFGKAFSFDGSKFITFPLSEELRTVGDNGKALTIEAWVYPKRITDALGIVGTSGCNHYQGGYGLNSYYNGFHFVFRSASSGWGALVGTGGLKLNQWQHVAGTYDGQTMKIYLNGELAGKTDFVNAINTNHNMPFYIGHLVCAKGSATKPFIGLIDEVMVSNVVKDSFPYAKISLDPSVEENPEERYHPPGIIPNSDFSLRGEKMIGLKPNPKPPPNNLPIYKYSENLSTNSQGKLEINNLEWDTYTLSVDGTITGYDIAASTPPQPVTLLPNTSETLRLNLAPHRDNTLLVTVKSASDDIVPGAGVRLYNTSLNYDQTIIARSNGQAFFSPLKEAAYNLKVSKGGYTGYSGEVAVSRQTEETVKLDSL